MHGSMGARPWIIAGVPASHGASGGAIRAHAIFAALARRTGAAMLPFAARRELAWQLLRPRRLRARLASTQLIPPRALRTISALVSPAVVDLHDHPVLQAEALGVPLDPRSSRRAEDLFRENVDRFERLVVPSDSFAELCGITSGRALVVSNGTDTTLIRPEPMPSGAPVVALASGAAPSRGIESLVEAVRRVRATGSNLRLALALSATGARSATYLAGLQSETLDEEWIEVSYPTFESMSGFLARAFAVVVPHPPGAYFDVATPVKLFDAMAAARPLVVTPRTETARIVTQADAGIVTGDAIDDLAGALADLLASPVRAERLGRNGRQAAEHDYDWRILSEGLADALLAE